MRTLMVGCGYVGMPLGLALADEGHEVVAVRRSASDTVKRAAAGISTMVIDITSREDLRRLPGSFDWVINTAAAPRGADTEAYRRTYLEGTRNLLEWLRHNPPAQYIYTSSTGVYGQDDGAWVDETSATEPDSATAKVLVQTERELLRAVEQHAFPATILRLAGIYGPGRAYWLRQLERGEARIPGDGKRWMNMVHRADIVGAVRAVLERGQSGQIYNLCDNEPVGHLDFFRWLAPKLGLPLPAFAEEGASARRRRGLTNKRVSNRRLREELGYALQYPSYREGYTQLLGERTEQGK
jgi:nucleoside-diphosphate-sugar epimerase